MSGIIGQRRAVTASRRILVEAFARSETAAGRPFSPRGIARHLKTPDCNIRKIIGEFEKAGLVARLAFGDGYVWVGDSSDVCDCPPVEPPVRAQHLADLLELARRETSATAVARKGRQADDVNRDVDALTPAQLEDIERLAALIVRHTPSSGGDATKISVSAFSWMETAQGGRGGWAIQTSVQQWAEEEHRLKYERAGKTEWNSSLAKSTVSNYRGAVNNLCYLAATHGLIARCPRNTGGEALLYAASWTPTLERWYRKLIRTAASNNATKVSSHEFRVRRGLRVLAARATMMNGVSRSTTDWHALRVAIEASHRANTITHDDYKAARSVWRLAQSTFAHRVQWGEELFWPMTQDEPLTLVPQAAIDSASFQPEGSHERDFSLWLTREGEYPKALIESPDGLRAWVSWSTLGDAQLRRAGLPPRSWDQLPGKGRRRREEPTQTTDSTVNTRLGLLARMAGFAARSEGVDWAATDLNTLCDPSLVDRFNAASELRTRTRRGEDGANTRRQLVMTVAWVVNGFLCARARAAEEAALAAGDDPAPARSRLATLRSWYRQLEALADELPLPKSFDLTEVAKRVVAIAEGWRGTNQVDGLLKIGQLRDLLIDEASATVNGMSLEEQLVAMRNGGLARNVAWARSLRLAVVLTIAQRVPLRGNTFSRLTVDMWQSSPVRGDPRRVVDPWDGSIRLDIPGSIMKSRRDFRPCIITPENVRSSAQMGSGDHETALCRPLLELWFAPGGAREFCCTVRPHGDSSPQIISVPWLFPDILQESHTDLAIRRGRRRQHPGKRRRANALGRWDRMWLSRSFRDAVIRNANSLGLEPDRLRSVRGALGFHSIRRLFGTYWAPTRLVYTSRLLDHRDIAFTAAVYTAQDESVISLDAAAHHTSSTASVAREQEQWKVERAQLFARIASLTERLVGSPQHEARAA